MRNQLPTKAHSTQYDSKALKGVMHICREIYYFDLKKGVCSMVYPKQGSPENENHTAFVYDYLKNGHIVDENKVSVAHFLNRRHIQNELRDKNYIEMKYRRKGTGSEEWCVLTIMIVKRRYGVPAAAVMMIQSIDHMVRDEERLIQHMDEEVELARRENQEKTELLYNISHDIRTPLNAILGLDDIAMMNIDDKERVLNALQKIKYSGEYLLNLVNELLDASKLEGGKLLLVDEPFDLSDSVQKMLTFVQTQMTAKQQEFHVHIGEIRHANVIGDVQRLQQILINILGNAVKYTPEKGRIRFDIYEKYSEDPKKGIYEFVVEDNGIGMTQEFVKKIFDPFTRADESNSRKVEGTGLGMTIALKLTRMMGGDIRVNSKPGVGTKVIVHVCLKLDPEKEKSEEIRAAEKPEGKYRGRKALLAEDNILNQEVAKNLIDYLGMTLDMVDDGKKAVDKLIAMPEYYYDLVFMDVRMPVMDGYEASAKIRSMERPDLRLIPIIAMTADTAVEDVYAEHAAGMNGHISKPFDLEKLDQAISKVLNI